MAKDKKPNLPDDVKKLIDQQIEEGSKPDSVDEINQIKNLDEAIDADPLNDVEAPIESDAMNGDDNGIDESLYTGEGFKQGAVVKVNIADALKKDFTDYAMSVIVARALPDVKDGLKPSQRRVLVAMRDLALWPNSAFRKSAKIAGQTTGDYHPHGEQIVYPTLVRMAQDFAMRYPLVHGQGNFGSIDGDPPAQMRYTEAKFSKIAVELMRDIDKGTVLFRPNYDGHVNEPVVLPAAFPNLLANGSEGIAVGMATRIPPHNLSELIDALVFMIDKGNTWNGTTLYNKLRQLREEKNRIPHLLANEPYEYWENYFDVRDLAFKEKVEAVKAIIKEGSVEQSKAKALADDYEALMRFITESRETSKTEGETFSQINTNMVTLYPKFVSQVTTQELMEHVKGPDFPTGGHIFNQKEILNFYETGRGKIKTRGVMTIEEDSKGRQAIIITELPFQVNKALLIQQIADLVQNDKIQGIKDLRDESAKNEIRVVIELKAGFTPQIVIGKLYKYTPLQLNFSGNMIALVDDEPKTLNLRRMLELYLDHRMTVVIRKLEYELAQSKYQAHILEGLLKALDFIDEVIKVIRASKTQDEARANLIARFDLTEVQAQAILDMQLRRLAALERQKIEDEYNSIMDTIKHHEQYLSSDAQILTLIRADLLEVKDKYGDKRRTKVYKGDVDMPQEEDLINKEATFITISKTGYIKRINPEEYRVQHRGGKGSIGAKFKENDYINHVLLCSTHDWLFIFTQDGRVFKLRAYEVPEFKKTSRGLPIVNLLAITNNTDINAVLALGPDAKESKYIVMVTEKGIVKKSALSEFDNIRKNGLTAINLKDNDKLITAQLTSGKEELIIVTKNGMSIRFTEKQIKQSGRNTMGVKGITLKDKDAVIYMAVIKNEKDMLFVVSENGYGKCSKLSNFRIQKRGGKGISAAKLKDKTGSLVVSQIFTEEEKANDKEIIVITKNGIVIRTTIKNIPILGRLTSGVRVIKVADNDKVVGLAA
jgi:DNA gyrase subunit A